MVHKTPNANRGYRDKSVIVDKKTKKTKPKSGPAQSSKKPQEWNESKEDVQHEITWAPSHEQEQQLILNIFRNAFTSVLSSPDNLTKVLQEIKQALFNRDFDKAFGNEEYLHAYAARWSPTRAMCYERVMHRAVVELNLEPMYPNHDPKRNYTAQPDTVPRKLKVVSIGGGAAEMVALAAFLRGKVQQATSGEMLILDSAPWKPVNDKLYAALTTPPPVSPYASAAIKEAAAAAGPFISADRLSVAFEQRDVLALSKQELESLIGDKPLLVTICFTLNELFTAGGLGATSRFLSDLSAALPRGSLLLVIDSAGNYSEVGVGSQAKRYPMQWLMDKVLDAGTLQPGKLLKIETDESVWFRPRQGLEYPIQLENMRHQVHVYRVHDDGSFAVGLGLTRNRDASAKEDFDPDLFELPGQMAS